MSFIFGGNTGASFEDIQRKRAIAEQLLLANASTPRSVGEGLSAIGRALAARAIEKRTSRQDQENRAAFNAKWGALFGGAPAMGGGTSPSPGYAPAPAGPGAQVADDAMLALGRTPMRPYRDAIASIESAGSGDYSAVGPTHATMGRALGRYQIMEANIAPWSREVLGREVSPEEFLANPQIQDAIFDGKFGAYLKQFGEEGAAQAWFAGPGGVGKTERKDVLGTNVGEYGRRFMGALGGETGAPAQMDIGTLAELAGDPYANQGQKAVIEALLGQQLGMMDPLRQLELQKAQLELAQMQNPSEPEVLTERKALAAAAGLQPGTPAYAEFMATGKLPAGPDVPNLPTGYTWADPANPSAGVVLMPGYTPDPGVTVNVGDGAPGLGKLSTDYGYVLDPATGQPVIDPATGLPKAAPVPGSPAATEVAKAETTAATKQSGQTVASDIITTATKRALDANSQRVFGGVIGALQAYNPATPNAEVYRQVDVLKANAKVENLQAMRMESPTGGALGNVTEGETKMLADQAGALDPKSPNFERDVLDYTRNLLRTVHGDAAGDAIFAQMFPQADAAGPSDDDLFKEYGIAR